MSLCSKFRGCLVGALMGDCIGAPFEGENRASKTVLNNYFKKLLDPNLKVPYKSYTDDTAMTKCIVNSFIEKREFSSCDIAKKFVKEYYSDPNRGYGRNVVDVFAALRATKFSDVFAPAALQFGGTGSYGNGGAMRIAPVALFCYDEQTPVVIDMAKQSALITHANRLGYNGAILQCLAVHEVLKSENDLSSTDYLETLITHMRKVEKYSEDEIIEGDKKSEYIYVPALEKVKILLEKGNDITVSEIEEKLGNDIAAHRSVPTAIYIFLRAQSSIEGVKSDNPFQRTIHYALSIGGDTDTIASMAGSIAGAYYGFEEIPENLQRHCEGIKDIIECAEKLFKLKQPE